MRLPFGSTMAIGWPHAGSSVVATTWPSGLVTATPVTGPPAGGVYAVEVWLASTSHMSVARPLGSYPARLTVR